MAIDDCPRCLVIAREDAFSNWLDDKGLRVPHPDPAHKGDWLILRELTPEEEAEVESWAQTLVTDGDTYYNLHTNHEED